jgi:hypothetical protein
VSRDRFIEFGVDAELPSRDAVVKIVETFFGGMGETIDERFDDRLIVNLPGRGADAVAVHLKRFDSVRRERWIEIVFEGGSLPTLDVLTREHDAFTNGLADALADVLARALGGEERES